MIRAHSNNPSSLVAAEALEKIIEVEAEHSMTIDQGVARLFYPNGDTPIEGFEYVTTSPDGLLGRAVLYGFGGVEYPEGYLIHASGAIDDDISSIIVAATLTSEVEQVPLDMLIKQAFLRLGHDAARFSQYIKKMTDQTFSHYRGTAADVLLKNSMTTPKAIQDALLLEEGQAYQFDLEQSGIYTPRSRSLSVGRLGVDAIRLDRVVHVDKNSDGIKTVELTTDRANRNHPHVCRDCSHGIGIGALRITTTVEPVDGLDHHHYHPQCFSTAE